MVNKVLPMDTGDLKLDLLNTISNLAVAYNYAFYDIDIDDDERSNFGSALAAELSKVDLSRFYTVTYNPNDTCF